MKALKTMKCVGIKHAQNQDAENNPMLMKEVKGPRKGRPHRGRGLEDSAGKTVKPSDRLSAAPT